MVGDHQSTQSPIQHHPAQLSPQTQLSLSALVPGSNLNPSCLLLLRRPVLPVTTSPPQRPWLPFKALSVAANNHRPPAEQSLSGIHREPGAPRTEPRTLPHPSALVHSPRMADTHSPSVLCSEIPQAPLQLHNLLLRHPPCPHPCHCPPSFHPANVTGSLQLPPVQQGHLHTALSEATVAPGQPRELPFSPACCKEIASRRKDTGRWQQIAWEAADSLWLGGFRSWLS